jgi:hypothetical protein
MGVLVGVDPEFGMLVRCGSIDTEITGGGVSVDLCGGRDVGKLPIIAWVFVFPVGFMGEFSHPAITNGSSTIKIQ